LAAPVRLRLVRRQPAGRTASALRLRSGLRHQSREAEAPSAVEGPAAGEIVLRKRRGFGRSDGIVGTWTTYRRGVQLNAPTSPAWGASPIYGGDRVAVAVGAARRASHPLRGRAAPTGISQQDCRP
jgi:hypothetical protein